MVEAIRIHPIESDEQIDRSVPVLREAFGARGAYSQTRAGVPGLSVTERPYSATSPSALRTSQCTQHAAASSSVLVRLT